MKTLFAALLALALTASAPAQEAFPGLKGVLTEAEWKRAGLDKLSPDEIGVIDAAMIRHLARVVPVAAAGAAAAPAPAPAPASPGFWQRFGLPTFDGDWRDAPPLRAKVVAWESSNRFRLDNGQVWEGFDPIRQELVGKAVEIQARPGGKFNLAVEGVNTTVRVYRLR